MNVSTLPLFDRLATSRSVLLAGAGGGFDVYAALPIYFALRARGVSVHLANFSFASLRDLDAVRPAATVVEVRASTRGPAYFPEAQLARWLAKTTGEESARVFAFEPSGVRPLRDGYAALCADLEIDAIVLVDGGTDSLMRGDEVGLGTPEADMASIAAVDGLDVATRLLVSVGFGVDAFHGVSHALVLENIARVSRAGGFLGAFSLLPEMPEVQRYRDAVLDAQRELPETTSIVHTSIVAAIEGRFGDAHASDRTKGSRLWINPLTSLCFAFDLPLLAAGIEFLPMLRHTDTLHDVSRVIESHQRGCEALRPWTAIPI